MTAAEIKREKWLIERMEELWKAVGSLAEDVQLLAGEEAGEDIRERFKLIRGGKGAKP